MRTFQYSDAKSHKFWNIDINDVSFTVTYGKIGTPGTTQTKTFPTPEKALAEADKLIREKTTKGYTETTPKAGGMVSDAEAIEKSLIENPHDGTGWRAYADFLAEHDDPRGEFMQVQLALEDESLASAERKKLQAREKALLKKHETEWLGTLAPFLLDQQPPKRSWRPNTITYRFRHGWLSELDIPSLGVEFTRALNNCQEARFLQHLHIHQTAYEYPTDAPNIPDYADGTYAPGPDLPRDVDSDRLAFALLAKFPYLASIRVLNVGNAVAEDYSDSDQCHTDGETAYHLLKQMPHIEEVRLLAHRVDTNKLFVLPMPDLRVLQVFHASNYPLAKLASNTSIKNLTHLLMQPHAPDEEQPYIRIQELRAICKSANFPKLSHLLLRYTTLGDEGIEELLSSSLYKQLKLLDLMGGCVTDEGARMLSANPHTKKLERLNLDVNALTQAGIDLLKQTGVPFSAKNQHNEVPPYDGDELPEFLFYADIE